MTLEQMKEKVYAMIEEYDEKAEDLTQDNDLATKMNGVINQIQNELARFKKLSAKTTLEVTKGQEINVSDIARDIYQLNMIRDVDFDIIGDTIIFNEDGKARIFYYRYPKQIDSETEDDFKLDLPTDCLEIMPYGVAGDILKSDVSSQYGTIYSNRYKELLQTLDPRHGIQIGTFSGGYDI